MSSWISRAKFIMEGKSPKITQKDLIKVMGKTTRGAVGHYFTGRSRPTLDQLEDLAKYLGVSLSWLVSATFIFVSSSHGSLPVSKCQRW
jgi:transcriptional regulator with XRE-family HTH domain